MSEPIRFGLVGCGAISGVHANAITAEPNRVLAGVCDIVEDKSAPLATKHNVPSFTNFADMLPHVDAVAICVPSGLHGELSIQAARAGKHILVEKPVEISIAAANLLVEECNAANLKNTCISQHRFAPDIQKAKRSIEAQEFGRLIQADCYNKWYRSQSYYDSGDWRGTWALDGGGCLMNQGVHYVDMLQWITGGVKAVRALTRTASHTIEVEDTACALLEFNNGAIGVLQGSTSAFPGFAERLEFHGEFGAIYLESDRIKVWDFDQEALNQGPYGRGVQQHPVPNIQSFGQTNPDDSASSSPAIWGDLHKLQYDDFVNSILTDTRPLITCRDALEPLKIILAVYESGRREGERVEVNSP